MGENLNQLYEFGPFRLDPAERMLLRGAEAVPLTPKAFDVLLALVKEPGRLLEKESLLKTVWPDSFVEENNLADNVSRLRRALGDGQNGLRFIETVPKRGYRFVAEVTKSIGAVATPIPAASPIVEDAALPDGLDGNQTVPLIASSPVPRGNRSATIFRVVVFLAPLLLGSGLWLEFWLKKRIEVYRLEVKADSYVARWTEHEVRKGIEYYNRVVSIDPNSASAYAGLATGWNFLSDLHISPREAMPRAKAAAIRSVQLDPSLAKAHVSLGVIKMQYEWDWSGAEQEFKRAIALDSAHNAGHQLYGWYLIAVGRFEEAQAEMKHALEADPLEDFNLWELGLCFYFTRQYEPAVEQYRRAIGVEPNSHWSHLLLGWALEQQGKFPTAITELKAARRLNDNPQVSASLAHAYAVSNEPVEAQKILAELLDTAKRRYVSPYDVATVYAGLGDKQETLAWLERALEDRSGWLALWLKVDPKFDAFRSEPRFRDLLRRIGHVL